MNIKFIKTYIVCFLVFTTSSLFALNSSDWAVLINLSGKQRMLTQKMSKEAVQIYLDINRKESAASLQKSADLFDKTLQGIIKGDNSLNLKPVKDKSIVRKVKKLSIQWGSFKKNVESIVAAGNKGDTPDNKHLDFIKKNNISLLKKMNEIVQSIEKSSQRKSGINKSSNLAIKINLAGKQRMLSQKMTKAFLFLKHSASDDEAQQELQKATQLFDQTLKGLVAGDQKLKLTPTSNSAIISQLDKVTSIWNKLKDSFAKAANGEPIAQSDIDLVISNNLSLLSEMNKAVKMYEKEV